MTKNRMAVALGRKGGKARARNLSPARLRAIGKQGAAARWGVKEKPKGRRRQK